MQQHLPTNKIIYVKIIAVYYIIDTIISDSKHYLTITNVINDNYTINIKQR